MKDRDDYDLKVVPTTQVTSTPFLPAVSKAGSNRIKEAYYMIGESGASWVPMHAFWVRECWY